MSVCPPAWNSSDSTGLIFMEYEDFPKTIFLENLAFFSIWLENRIYYKKTYVHL